MAISDERSVFPSWNIDAETVAPVPIGDLDMVIGWIKRVVPALFPSWHIEA
jgi:hypothetical protein